MGRIQYKDCIDKFVSAYVNKDIYMLGSILADECKIDYSTIGEVEGKDNVIAALSLSKNYQISYGIISNKFSYVDGDYNVCCLGINYLFGISESNILYPLIFGGKLLIKSDANNKIVLIAYSQEYQTENTIFIKNWKLAKQISNLTIIEKYLNIDLALEQNKNVVDFCYILFYCIDSKNIKFLKKICVNNIHIRRFAYQKAGKFEINNVESIIKYIDDCKNYYDMDQFSLSYNGCKDENGEIIVNLLHIDQHHLGTKRISSLNTYNIYYSEDVYVRIIKEGNGFKAKEIIIDKLSDFRQLGNDIYHI